MPLCLTVVALCSYQWGVKNLNQAYLAWLDRTKDYVGMEHFSALFDLLGSHRVGKLVDEIMYYVEKTLENRGAPYINSLLDGMPEQTKLPKFRSVRVACKMSQHAHSPSCACAAVTERRVATCSTSRRWSRSSTTPT